MTDFNIEIIQQPSNSLEITTATSGIEINTIEVITVGGSILEISNRDKILPSDFPDTYPISWTTGLLPLNRIENFASGVSGLLPVTSITGGYGIGVTNVSGAHTIYSTITSLDEANSLVATVFNKNGSALPKFTVVYISGAQGDLPIVAPALANGEPKSSKTFGITEEQIPAMGSGRVVVYGNIYGLNTDQYNPTAPHGDINGQVMYLSPTVSGGVTLTKPYAPDHLVSVGTVIRTHQNQGIFNVRIQNGFELQELHNVATTGAISGQFLKYDGSLWRNNNILSSDISDFASAVSGISPNISISGTSGINVDKNGNNYTIYTTGTFGLNSSQIQSLLNSGVSIYVVSGTGNFSSLSVGGTGVSVNGHTHVVSNITNFNSGVSGLLPSVSGSGYAAVGFFNNVYLISITGLQPSGNYSLVGHTHSSSDITNFNSSVSGLLLVKDIVAGTNITINSLSGIYTINSISTSGGGGSVVISNPADNRVLTSTGSTSGINAESNLTFDGSTLGISGLLSASSGNFINSLQLNGVSVSLSGHTHTASNIVDFNSSVSGLLTPYALLSSGNFSTLFVTGIPVSVSGHAHTASSITNFNSAVSGLLPSVSGSGFTTVTFSNNVYTVGVTGLQPSGNYSLIGHTHIASDITDFNSAVSGLIPIKNINGSGYVIVSSSGGIFTVGVTGLQPSGNYSLVGHTHSSSDITNFNSSVSGLLPSVSGSGYATVGFLNNIYTISVTGLQPSGNYSVVGHTHIASNITDFNSAVSGLLPVKNISGSGYVSVTSNAGNYTVSVTGLQPSGNYSVVGHTHLASDITNFNSATSGLLIPYALLSSGNFSSLYVNGTAVSVSGHTHTSSQIADFNSSVSGLINVKNITGSGYVSVTSSAGNFTIGVTGLQPSGNYSLVGHTHTASNITDFNSSVSGLLNPYALLSSGNFNYLAVNGVPVSTGTGGGGGGANITNPGTNRVLLSDGTANGIIAQSGLTFNGSTLFINGVNSRNGQNLYMWANFR